jgi:hypothetical protein
LRCFGRLNFAGIPYLDLIHGEENVKFGYFRCCKKLTIHESSQPSVAGRLAIVTGQSVPESLIDTFVDQNAHLGTCEQKVLCFFECSEGRITREALTACRHATPVTNATSCTVIL